MPQNMTQVAAAEGLDFRFDRLRMTNTFDAHRVVHLAAAHGLQDAMEERLMQAYVSEGELLSDPATLRRLAADAGLPAGEVDELLATDGYADAVRADERTAAELGISAVPFFVLDRSMGASGAHEPELLLKMLRKGWEARQPALSVVADGATCGPGGC